MRIKKKILVALSGGVDSAVSAALLKKQGFDVFGAHFRFFDPPKADGSLKKEKLVAEKLNIPLEIVDARKEFKKKVIDYFIKSYKEGITPNPCVVCNKEMKFRLLFELLKKYKADYIATGHYARIRREFSIFNFQFSNNSKISKFQNVKLLEAKDKTKDQSYFLYKLNQRELAKIIFPLGDYTKVKVREIARKLKLPISDDEESQDVCFLTDTDINLFLKKYIKTRFGNIVDEKKNILGEHKGLPFYTIGQRKGIEIGGGGPYFVIGKDQKKNELVVSNDPKKLFTKKFEVEKVNWIEKREKSTLKVQVQIRYHAPKVSAIIKPSKSGRLIVETKKSLRAVTSGQSAVFYKNKEVLGGGIIA